VRVAVRGQRAGEGSAAAHARTPRLAGWLSAAGCMGADTAWLRAEVSISHLSQPCIARLFYNVIVVGPIVFICLCNWCRNGFVGRVAQL
jgi:hypothetical protein